MKNSGSILNYKFLLIVISSFILSFFIVPNVFAAGGISILPDQSIVIQMINFLFLIWVLNIILYRPIRNVLIQRKEKIAGLENGIEQCADEVKEKDEAFKAGIAEARANGVKEKNQLEEAAAEEEKKIIEEINEKAQANLLEIREKIAADTDNVQEALQKEVDAFADAIGEKILGRAV